MRNLAAHAYALGTRSALNKLGTEAGPIAYAPRFTRDRDELDEDKLVGIWAENDREPFVTGDESAVGMPSPGSAVKNAGMNDAGFAQFSDGVYGNGGADADRTRVDRNLRLSSAIQNAYDANNNYDQSYGEEPPATQPHGSKYAASLQHILDSLWGKTAANGSAFGVGSGLKPTTGSNSLNPTANKPMTPAVINPQQNLAATSFNTNIGIAQGTPATRQMGGSGA